MEPLRWLRLAPLAIAVAAGAVGPGRAVVAGTGTTPAWDPPPCPRAGGAPPGAMAWYRLDPVLDARGSLAARRLTLGVAGGVTRRLDLPPESFASGPVNGLVLAGADDGTRSRLRLLDPARGCAVAAGDEAAVIRSGILAADGRSIVEHRVSRRTRADLGVWRRSMARRGGSERLLAGLPADPELGPTFSTDLLVAPDGRVVASACTPAGCRVRVLDPATHAVSHVRAGTALGVVGGGAIVRAACPGEPCAVERVDLATGARRTLVDRAWTAVLGGRTGGDLVYEAAGGVATLEVATGRRLEATPVGSVPVGGGSTATAGAAAPPGAVALAPRGRPSAGTLQAIDPVLGTLASIGEAGR